MVCNDRIDTSDTGDRVSLEFRSLAPGDVSQFIDLWDEAFSTDPYAFRTTKDKWSQKPTSEKEKNFESSILDPNFILGAFCHSVLVGMVGIRQQEADFMVWGTFVHSSFRGGNVGHSLVEKAIEKISSSHPDVHHLHLEVFSSAQAARSLYKKLGFIETESRTTGEIIAVRPFR